MYFIKCHKNNDRIFVYEKVDNILVCIHHSFTFKGIYDFIRSKNIDFKDVIIINLTFYDLFYHFVSEESINPDIKGGRL